MLLFGCTLIYPEQPDNKFRTQVWIVAMLCSQIELAEHLHHLHLILYFSYKTWALLPAWIWSVRSSWLLYWSNVYIGFNKLTLFWPFEMMKLVWPYGDQMAIINFSLISCYNSINITIYGSIWLSCWYCFFLVSPMQSF